MDKRDGRKVLTSTRCNQSDEPLAFKRMDRWVPILFLLLFVSLGPTGAFTIPPGTVVHLPPDARLALPLFVSTSVRAPLIDFSNGGNGNNNEGSADSNAKHRVRRKYKRKRTIPESERQLFKLKQKWKKDYESIVSSAVVKGDCCPSIWSFENLFPEPVLDEASIKQDLYGARERDAKTTTKRQKQTEGVVPPPSLVQVPTTTAKMRSSFYGGISMMRVWRERRLSSAYIPKGLLTNEKDINTDLSQKQIKGANDTVALAPVLAPTAGSLNFPSATYLPKHSVDPTKVDRDLTRLVENRMFGYRRTLDGEFQYETSLMGDGAVQFRDGVRLGKPLRINADRLNYLAKKELQHGRVEEAQELYERAISIDPQDGRAYLGLSRCAERRSDYTLARDCLRSGIANSVNPPGPDGGTDRGANPYLLQALGCLEEKIGNSGEAERLYIAAAKSRPWHAAAWVALAQLRTQKLGQSAEAGRSLFQAAERELQKAGKQQSSHVYTAWASLELHKAGDVRRARELFKEALKIDPKCSAAYLQLGVMEAGNGNWEDAQSCFDAVLKFDQRNSRVLQAYAIMETKRPGGKSRRAIDLFERALKSNSRDAGVYQAYALYVAKFGDVDSARDLLARATEVNKRHAAAWQAWGVLEMNEGKPERARSIFQQGIWACANLAGGQSGGYDCARLWQAWGLLEAQEGDHAAARRCFSRALDADTRNVAAVTCWALMEEGLGNIDDARYILERALHLFAPGSEGKKGLWATYEKMEQRLGNINEAQRVYQRSMRETLSKAEVAGPAGKTAFNSSMSNTTTTTNMNQIPQDANDLRVSQSEVGVVRWADSSSFCGEVWMNDNAIESKLPSKSNNRRKTKSRTSTAIPSP